MRSAIEAILKKSESSQRVLEEATEDFRIQLLQEDEDGEEILTVDRITARHQPDHPAGRLDDLQRHPAARDATSTSRRRTTR